MIYDLPRRLVAESLGTALLVCTIIGSGIMAGQLTENMAIALLAASITAGAILVVLITILGPISGAHFNPAVTAAFVIRRELPLSEAVLYCVVQIISGIFGAMVANAMFSLDILQFSSSARTGVGQWLAETVATFGLVGAIFAGIRFRPDSVPWLVGLYIISAHWFTSSTSFANPAVSIGRAFSDTFGGINPADVPAFVIAQLVGAVLAVILFGWLLRTPE